VRRRDFLRAGLAAGTIGWIGRPAQAVPSRPARRPARGAPSRDDVLAAMRLVNDHWTREHPAGAGDNTWDWATYHSGNMAMYRLVRDRALYDHSPAWARRHRFSIRRDEHKPFFADHQCAGQVYLDLYMVDRRPGRLAAITDEIEAMVDTGETSYWTWVDALHMAMPVLARLGVLYGKRRYLRRMHQLYAWTKTRAGGDGLYDESRRLWWRDQRFIGTSTHWSRGNGWAVAALAKVLGALPADDPRRPAYVRIMRDMAAALLPIQRADGFWAADLGDPEAFPSPETSGTAFFTYGMAWGINHGILDAAVYRPPVEKAWRGMVTTAVHPDGFLGYVQGTGAKPSDHQPVAYDDTTQFGVGAFLLAGSQVAALRRGH
jgi:rhamnogalacturonyl hydrolase YesR